MRPVNLIPPEDRRGEQAPLRTGPLPYILLGALVAVLLGVTALVLVGNQISESKAEVAKLEGEDAVAAARAQQLASYTQFRSMSEQRVATVQSLADSRFDWERVMRELALVLPSDVWLTNLTATASPEVSLDSGGGSSGTLRPQVPGPALELNGCASGQEAVAGFVTALKDIDGVTRVGVESSELAEEEGAEEAEAASTEVGANTGSSDGECRTRAFIAKFTLVVAFDAAPIPSEESPESTVSTPVETAESTASSESTESTEGG
ncbi:MAG TPA: PilN domain-containing protein [Solirubrobacterales bacterium]|nr:PilN domain-containing protein [Solirubrobacterales bacterium]